MDSTISTTDATLLQLTRAAEVATIAFGRTYEVPELPPIDDESEFELNDRRCCEGVTQAASRGITAFMK